MPGWRPGVNNAKITNQQAPFYNSAGRFTVVKDTTYFPKSVVINKLQVTDLIAQDLLVKGIVTFDASVNIVGDVSIGGFVIVDGSSTLLGDVSMGHYLYVQNDVSFQTKLLVVGDVSFLGGLSVVGDVSFGDGLIVANDASMMENLYVDKKLTVMDEATFKDHVEMESTLHVVEDASFVKDVSIGGTLTVYDQATLVDVSVTNLSVSGGLYGGSALDIMSDVSMHHGLSVVGESSFNNGVTMHNTLQVSNQGTFLIDVSINNTLKVGAHTTLVDTSTGNLTVTGGAYFTSDVSIHGVCYVDALASDVAAGRPINLENSYPVEGSILNSNSLVTKAYVDQYVEGIKIHEEVDYATVPYIQDGSGALQACGNIGANLDGMQFTAPMQGRIQYPAASGNPNKQLLYIPNYIPNATGAGAAPSLIIDGHVLSTADIPTLSDIDNFTAHRFMIKDQSGGTIAADQEGQNANGVYWLDDISMDGSDPNTITGAGIYFRRVADFDSSLTILAGTHFYCVSGIVNRDAAFLTMEPNHLDISNFVIDVSDIKFARYSKNYDISAGLNIKFTINPDGHTEVISVKEKLRDISTIAFGGTDYTDSGISYETYGLSIHTNGGWAKFAQDVSINGNLTVGTATQLDDTLTVTGTTQLNNSLTVAAYPTILGGTLTVTGDVSANDVSVNNLAILGTIYGPAPEININSDVSVNGGLSVTGDVSFGSTLEVFGKSTLADVSINNGLTVVGDASFTNNVTFHETVTISGDTAFYCHTNRIYFDGNGAPDASFIVDTSHITFMQDVSFVKDVSIGGILNVNGETGPSTLVDVSVTNLSVSGSIYGGSPLNIMSDVCMNYDLTVSGGLVVGDSLQVVGTVSASSVEAAVVVQTTGLIIHVYEVNKGTLSVSGDVSFNSTLNVIGESSFNDVSINGGLTVVGDSSFAGDVSMYGTVYIGNQIHDDVLIVGTLEVMGDASFNGDVSFNGALVSMTADLSAHRIVCTNPNVVNISATTISCDYISINKLFYAIADPMYFTHNAEFEQGLHVKGDSSFNDVSINGNLAVTDDSSFKKIVLLNDTTHVTFTDPVGTTGALQVKGGAGIAKELFVGKDVSFGDKLHVKDEATFYGSVYADSTLHVKSKLYAEGDISASSTSDSDIHHAAGHTGALQIAYGGAGIAKNLVVGGDVSFGDKLYVAKDASFAQKLYVFGDSSFNDVSVNNLTVQTVHLDSIELTSLNVVGDASFVGDVSINGPLSLYGDVSFVGDVSIGQNLYVAGESSFNDVSVNNLNVFGDASFVGTFNVAGESSFNDVSVNNLNVFGDASFVGGASFATDVSVGGIVYSNVLCAHPSGGDIGGPPGVGSLGFEGSGHLILTSHDVCGIIMIGPSFDKLYDPPTGGSVTLFPGIDFWEWNEDPTFPLFPAATDEYFYDYSGIYFHSQRISVKHHLDVCGSTYIGYGTPNFLGPYKFGVGCDASFAKDVSFNKNVYVNNLSVFGESSFNDVSVNNLNVFGESSFNNLNVYGESSFNDVSINGDLWVINDVSIGQNLYVARNIQQENFKVAIGNNAGNSDQSANAIAIGSSAGQTSQQEFAIAIGHFAGNSDQSANAIAIGIKAGSEDQSGNAIAIGNQAGYVHQSANAIAIGRAAGDMRQSSNAIAIGYEAGSEDQSGNAIAIGTNAGKDSQGANAIAIGQGAGSGTAGQPANTIVLNSYCGGKDISGGNVVGGITGYSSDVCGGTFINTLRGFQNAAVSPGFYPVYFNPITCELVYDAP